MNWYAPHLENILTNGHDVSPRGMPVREVLNAQLVVGDFPIMSNAVRKPNYRFMVAEWLWHWFGLDDVEVLAQYNSKMRDYSDDGAHLHGAYGPRFWPQLNHITRELLVKDPSTRQAVALIWRPDELETPSKDVPCTTTIQLFVRDGRLHSTFTMRSSDAWLGIPYDVFNFARLTACVAARLGVAYGTTTLNLGSAHLYEEHWLPALKAIRVSDGCLRAPRLSEEPPPFLKEVLVSGQYVAIKHDLNFWENSVWGCYARALAGPTSEDARRELVRAASWFKD